MRRRGGGGGKKTDIELAGEGGEAGLAVDGGEDMEGELLWAFYDDVVAGGVPANHVLVIGLLEEAGEEGRRRRRE